MLNTAMELAQCDKCQAYVFMCHVGGIRVIVDPGPLDGMDDVRRRLMMGRTVYRILPGRKLAQFGKLSTNGTGYLADHWCSAGTVGAQPVGTVAVGPPQAPVTPSADHGPQSAPVSGSQGHTANLDHATGTQRFLRNLPSRALPVTRPRSDPKPTRCDICRELITVHTPDVWSIEYDGRLVYAVHDSC